MQGYIQLRPQDTILPSFGSGPPPTVATADENLSTEVAVRDGGGKASPSVSIFSRAPLCSHTCRHCRCKPCDIATEHDDHICYNCEQRILFPERIPKWEMQKLPICDLWCLECATQRCCTRGPHQYHLCMECERGGVVFLAPAGGRTHGLPVMADWKSGSQLLSHPHRLSLQRRVVFSDCGCHLLRHALVCMTAYHLLVVIGLFA